MSSETERTLASNRRASFEYFILETHEAGIALTGTEIKSIRLGKASLQDGFARIEGGDVWLENVYVAPYEQGNRANPDPRRRRRLLLHRPEIAKLGSRLAQQGLTIIPLRIYLKGRRAKVALALAKGKKQHDKREAIAEREATREIERALNRRG